MKTLHLTSFILLFCCFCSFLRANNVKTTNVKFTTTVYTASSNLLLRSDCKIKITNFKGAVVKVLDTSYLKNKNLPQLNLPKGRYFVWIDVTKNKIGYWITI